jgi:hypothetical protein
MLRPAWLLLGTLVTAAGSPVGRIRHVPGEYPTIQAHDLRPGRAPE